MLYLELINSTFIEGFQGNADHWSSSYILYDGAFSCPYILPGNFFLID